MARSPSCLESPLSYWGSRRSSAPQDTHSQPTALRPDRRERGRPSV